LKFSVAHDDELTNSVFERAIQAVGKQMLATNIWLMWIDYETSFLNMAKCNLLCFLALQTPLLNIDLVLSKYIEVVTNYHDSVVECLKKSEEAVAGWVSEHHQEEYNQLAKLTLSKSQDELVAYMRDAVYPHTSEQVNDRISFEQELLNSQAPANSQAWLKYIAFEQKKQQPQRAKMLFEVALLEPQVDICIWTSYIKFVQKDVVSARALFERCR